MTNCLYTHGRRPLHVNPSNTRKYRNKADNNNHKHTRGKETAFFPKQIRLCHANILSTQTKGRRKLERRIPFRATEMFSSSHSFEKSDKMETKSCMNGTEKKNYADRRKNYRKIRTNETRIACAFHSDREKFFRACFIYRLNVIILLPSLSVFHLFEFRSNCCYFREVVISTLKMITETVSIDFLNTTQ